MIGSQGLGVLCWDCLRAYSIMGVSSKERVPDSAGSTSAAIGASFLLFKIFGNFYNEKPFLENPILLLPVLYSLTDLTVEMSGVESEFGRATLATSAVILAGYFLDNTQQDSLYLASKPLIYFAVGLQAFGTLKYSGIRSYFRDD